MSGKLFGGFYRVYPDGRVTSLRSGVERELKQHISSSGYRSVALNISGRKSCHSVHRLLAFCFLPNPELKPQVNHIDGNKLNNNLGNLEWCTDSENKLHAHQTGLMPRSTPAMRAHRHKCANRMIRARRRFSDDDIAQIYHLFELGESMRSIGRRLGCSHSLISNLLAGKSYVRRVS